GMIDEIITLSGCSEAKGCSFGSIRMCRRRNEWGTILPRSRMSAKYLKLVMWMAYPPIRGPERIQITKSTYPLFVSWAVFRMYYTTTLCYRAFAIGIGEWCNRLSPCSILRLRKHLSHRSVSVRLLHSQNQVLSQ